MISDSLLDELASIKALVDGGTGGATNEAIYRLLALYEGVFGAVQRLMAVNRELYERIAALELKQPQPELVNGRV